MRIYFLIILFLPIFSFAQTDSNKHKAIELNKKAAKLSMGLSSYDTKMNQKILSILDTVNKLNPNYYAGHYNKVKPLINLKKYKEALSSVKKSVGKNIGDTITGYIQQGAIYELYLDDLTKAKYFYKKAYETAIGIAKNNRHKNVSYEYPVVFALSYYQGKTASLKYLEDTFKYYRSGSSKNKFEQLWNLVKVSKFTRQEKINIFGQTKS